MYSSALNPDYEIAASVAAIVVGSLWTSSSSESMSIASNSPSSSATSLLDSGKTTEKRRSIKDRRLLLSSSSSSSSPVRLFRFNDQPSACSDEGTQTRFFLVFFPFRDLFSLIELNKAIKFKFSIRFDSTLSFYNVFLLNYFFWSN